MKNRRTSVFAALVSRGSPPYRAFMATLSTSYLTTSSHEASRKAHIQRKDQEKRATLAAICSSLSRPNHVDLVELRSIARESGLPKSFRAIAWKLMLGVDSTAADADDRWQHRLGLLNAYKDALGPDALPSPVSIHTQRSSSAELLPDSRALPLSTPSSALSSPIPSTFSASTTGTKKRRVRPEIQRALQKARQRQHQKVYNVTETGNYVSRFHRDRDILDVEQDLPSQETDTILPPEASNLEIQESTQYTPKSEPASLTMLESNTPESATSVSWNHVLAVKDLDHHTSSSVKSIRSRGGNDSSSNSRRTSHDGLGTHLSPEQMETLTTFQGNVPPEYHWMRLDEYITEESEDKLAVVLERLLDAYLQYRNEERQEQAILLPTYQERDATNSSGLSSSPDHYHMSRRNHSNVANISKPTARNSHRSMYSGNLGSMRDGSHFSTSGRFNSDRSVSVSDDPSVGGMVQILLFLMQVGICWEWELYWCFRRIMDMIDDWLDITHLQLRLAQFLTLFRTQIPDLYTHFEEEELDIKDWAKSWLRYMLMRELPIKCAARLWDFYLAGPDCKQDVVINMELSACHVLDVHVYVCIAILMLCKDNLDELEQSEIRSALHRLPTVDMNEVLRCARRLERGESMGETCEVANIHVV